LIAKISELKMQIIALVNDMQKAGLAFFLAKRD